MKSLRIAAFGCRHFPPVDGSAGEDKFAYELYPRIARLGHQVYVFTRTYERKQSRKRDKIKGVNTYCIRTIRKSGYDTLIHSFLCTFNIIINDVADIIHIHNGGNSIWAFFLRIFGKKVYVSQDGVDWKREKWPWFGKIYLKISSIFTAYFPNQVIFDNIYAKKYFGNKFKKHFSMIEYGAGVSENFNQSNILNKLGIYSGEYVLFVGRFIPDKGVHYLIQAFNDLNIDMKLVLVGGSPNTNEYEKYIKTLVHNDPRIMFPGFIYGGHINKLIKDAYLYVQPSDVEGLSPVILQVMGLGTPLICSDIPENKYIVQDDAMLFNKSDINSLKNVLIYAFNNPMEIQRKANIGQTRILKEYNWDSVAAKYIEIFHI